MDLPPLTVEIQGHKRIFSQSFSGIGVQALPGCAHWRSWAAVQGLFGLCSVQDGGGGHFHRLLAELFLEVVEFTAVCFFRAPLEGESLWQGLSV